MARHKRAIETSRHLLGVDPRGLREAWLRQRSPSLRRRRKIAALAAVGLIDAALISLLQMGFLRHLPDPPLPRFDSDAVSKSLAAYLPGAPDGTLGALMYAALLTLAAWGGTRSTGRPLLADVLLAAAAAGGVGAAGLYLDEMLRREKRLCAYCLVATGVSAAMAPLALAELRHALLERGSLSGR